MPNEITAEELFAKATEMTGNKHWDEASETTVFLILTRAHATLMAERGQRKFDPGTPVLDEAGKLQGFKAKVAPERVRCWIERDHGGKPVKIWLYEPSHKTSVTPYTVTEGYFTAKGSTDD